MPLSLDGPHLCTLAYSPSSQVRGSHLYLGNLGTEHSVVESSLREVLRKSVSQIKALPSLHSWEYWVDV